MAEIVGSLILSSLLPSAGLGAGAALSIGELTISASTVGSLALVAGSVGLSYALQQKPPQQKPGNGELSTRQPIPIRTGGYGRALVPGSYMLYEAYGAAPGVVSVDVTAHVSGRCCAFRRLKLHDDMVTLIGSVVVVEADDRYGGSLIDVDWRLGLPEQDAFAFPIVHLPSLWTAAHRGDGIAALNLICQQGSTVEIHTKRFPNGKPEPAVVFDLYPIYDPRDVAQDPDDPDTWIAYAPYNAATIYAEGARVIYPSPHAVFTASYSGGTTYARYAVVTSGGIDWWSRIDGNIGNTPGADLTKWLPLGTPYYSRTASNTGNTPDTSPAKWTAVIQNPVLQLMDYLTDTDHGMGLDRDVLFTTAALANIIAQANLCDALVADKTGALGPRYTSSGIFNFDEDPASVIGNILSTCDGWTAEDGDGSLLVRVGVYADPDLTFEAKHIVGFSINYGTADEDVINELTISFIDPDNKYKEVAGDPWRDEDDISARGRVRSQSLGLTWVTRHSQARRLAKRAMGRLNKPHGTVTFTLYGLRALGQRWVKLQYPFLPQVDDCVVELSRGSIDFNNGTVSFDWLLADPDMDAWIPAIEEGDGPSEVVVGSNQFITDDVGNFGIDDAGLVIANELA